MSTLTLVRHGQARPFERESDCLSELGERQACGLADWWIRGGITFDEVYTGTLMRQQRTAALIGDKFRKHARRWPETTVLAGLNEYDAAGLMRHAGGDPKLAPLIAAAAAAEGPERNRQFQRMLEAVIAQWTSGALAAPGLESWPMFLDRIRAALRLMTRDGKPGRNIAAFTSGGPIGVAVQTVMQAPDQSAIELNWRVRNCSLTQFLFTRERISLDCFNAVPHLDGALLSFR
jgi:broad specificity phosphatase PhoE